MPCECYEVHGGNQLLDVVQCGACEAASQPETVWTLVVYSEDFVLQPEAIEWPRPLTEDELEDFRYRRIYESKAELWEEVKTQYARSVLQVRYVDGSRRLVDVWRHV